MAKKTIKAKKTVKKTIPRKTTAKKAGPVTTVDSVENSWARLFVLAEHWQSDMQFFSDELRFLRSLVDKYFLWLIDENHIEATKKMATKLGKIEKNRSRLDLSVGNHLKHLTNLIENPFAHDAQSCKDEHAKLEDWLADFSKDFREVKKGIFQLTEQVMESKKAQYVLGQ